MSRLILAWVLVATGVVMLLAAAWLVYWPVALALAGIVVAAAGGFLVQIPPKPAQWRPEPPTLPRPRR
jgi:hypothetical protein